MQKHYYSASNDVFVAADLRADYEKAGTWPSDAVPVSAEVFSEFTGAPPVGMQRAAGPDGLPVWAPRPPLPFAELKALKLAEINRDCDAEVARLAQSYPETEVLSWPKQEREARALLADPTAETPLVDAIATARDIDRVELASRIVAKSDTFAELSGVPFGKRQRIEDQLTGIEARLQAGEITEDQARAEAEALSYATA